jgi:hypothetical protein
MYTVFEAILEKKSKNDLKYKKSDMNQIIRFENKTRSDEFSIKKLNRNDRLSDRNRK